MFWEIPSYHQDVHFGHLFSPDSFQKLNSVSALMEEKNANNTWIGAHDVDQIDEFRFVLSGAVVPLGVWSTGQPNHREGNCVWFDRGVGLMVEDCNISMDYVCEIFQ